MRLPTFVLAVIALATSPARAEFVMCVGGQGVAPAVNTTVPPHAHLVYYADMNFAVPQKVTAKIDGKSVPVKHKELTATPFKMLVVEIDSDRTGTLAVTFDERPALSWTVRAMTMPKEVTGVTARYSGPSRPGEAGESFDGLAIRLPEGTPAVWGHVRIRSDAGGMWLETNVPMYTPANATRPMLRVGQFDCAPNISVAVLRQGFDLEATVTLVDGTQRAVTGMAPHLTLPTPLPPQPRPKNQRVQ